MLTAATLLVALNLCCLQARLQRQPHLTITIGLRDFRSILQTCSTIKEQVFGGGGVLFLCDCWLQLERPIETLNP